MTSTGEYMNTKEDRPSTWYQLDTAKLMEKLESSDRGLSPVEAERRLESHGPNELVEKARKSPWTMFLDQFKDFMIMVLIAAALVSGLIGEISDTIAIVVIVALNAVLGFVQEYRAEKAMAALKKMASPSATVVRDGRAESVDSKMLVPGDLVVLEAGNIVPADIRLTQAARLRIDEATLTGESAPVEKDSAAIKEEGLPVADRKNMAHKGTQVAFGRGEGLVTATGMRTELGRIASMLQDQKEERTPLQKRLAAFGRKLAYAVLAICAVVFVSGLFRGEPPLLMLLTAISLAVAAIPEALPAVITISLALGAKKLVDREALIRKLPAVETLGSVTYICSDKTGTLTLNRMTAEKIFAGEKLLRKHDPEASEGQEAPVESQTAEDPTDLLMNALALCNDVRMEASGDMIGDPTETALFDLARNKGYIREEVEEKHPRLAEIPFDSERKLMTTFHPWDDGRIVSFTKGAAEEILSRSKKLVTRQGLEEIDRPKVLETAEAIAGEGLRTLGVAMRFWDEVPDSPTSEQAETELVLIGMVGMMDPPRPEAAEAVSMCLSAGIRPVMITGDHPRTAEVIAERVGILGEQEKNVLSGRELGRLSLEDFEQRVEKIGVYARVAPEQKLKIVKALQDKGHFVAMTGDGVNDAPALKRADIGVAMGITGTDVSKEASHMILLDDNFATIVKAVREGRRIFDNIRKFIKYTMTSNSGEILTIFMAPFLGLPFLFCRFTSCGSIWLPTACPAWPWPPNPRKKTSWNAPPDTPRKAFSPKDSAPTSYGSGFSWAPSPSPPRPCSSTATRRTGKPWCSPSCASARWGTCWPSEAKKNPFSGRAPCPTSRFSGLSC